MHKKCKDKQHNCGEFKGNETKEEKLQHLTECKAKLQERIKKIDKAIAELE